jgi:hypothetical protein
MTMAGALRVGRATYKKRGGGGGSGPTPEDGGGAPDCVTGVSVSVDSEAPNGQKGPPGATGTFQIPR